MRDVLDDVTTSASWRVPWTRLLPLHGSGALALLALLQAQTAGAVGDCGPAMQACTLTAQVFCGDVRLEGCLNVCCPDAGCCKSYDNIGINGAQCCPSDPDFDSACSPGCVYTCKRPCGPQKCCSTVQNETCIPAADADADGTCCAAVHVCGNNCCETGEVCIPSSASGDQTCCPPEQTCNGKCCGSGEVCQEGTCCPSAQACGIDSCCDAGESCIGLGTCCPPAQVCGASCCTTDQRCRNHKKRHVCKRKKKRKGK